jgi:hypothetical protein
MRKTQRHTQKEMFAHIQACKQSKKPQRMYCKLHRITYSKFQYWAKKYRKQLRTDEINPGFIEVKLKPEAQEPTQLPDNQLHFHYPNGVQLLCSETINPAVLKTLINP